MQEGMSIKLYMEFIAWSWLKHPGFPASFWAATGTDISYVW